MGQELTETAWAFIDRASGMYGELKAQHFAQEMQANCLDIGMQSPIEHLFWIACHVLCEAHLSPINPEAVRLSTGEQVLPSGIYITPQRKVDKYKVDFFMSSEGFGPNDILTPVVVELDGHDFHDKDKRQRSYEKRRDRDLVRAGYRVIHFTGSDVVKDPFACAWEALHMVGLFVGTGLHDYDKVDPLGIGGL
jgi:very-short-patch-repair endonuclease